MRDEAKEWMALYSHEAACLQEALKRINQLEKNAECIAAAYARLKVDADVMRHEIAEYRSRLFEKEHAE